MGAYRGPVVDAHLHLWRFDAAAYPWLAGPGEADLARDVLPEEHRRAAGELDPAGLVLVEAVASDALAEARALDTLLGESGLPGAIVAHVPLDAPDLEARLDALAAATPRLRGIRDIVAVRPGHASFARAPDLLERPGFARGLEMLATRGLVFDLMAEPWQLPAALALAARLPALTLVIEHAGSPDFASAEGAALWRDGMRAAAALPNVAVKISALHCRMPGWTDERLADPIRALVDWFGPQRLAFASDYPVHDRTVPLARAYETFARAVADLPATDQAAMFAGTARRLYGF